MIMRYYFIECTKSTRACVACDLPFSWDISFARITKLAFWQHVVTYVHGTSTIRVMEGIESNRRTNNLRTYLDPHWLRPIILLLSINNFVWNMYAMGRWRNNIICVRAILVLAPKDRYSLSDLFVVIFWTASKTSKLLIVAIFSARMTSQILDSLSAASSWHGRFYLSSCTSLHSHRYPSF